MIINNVPRTSRLSDVNIGIEQFVDHSYYQQWNRQRYQTDPLSGPISPWHPWNKETILLPSRMNLKERYSWSTAPRWDREPMETGPIARLWISAVFGKKTANSSVAIVAALKSTYLGGSALHPDCDGRYLKGQTRSNAIEPGPIRWLTRVWSHTPICSMRSIR
ncbi:MAG: nickel-dependent hydrogenase large subunit [Acidobacteria bacterium]|nr:nickel-dependent hydrogenase large subunit [Acidobacteriota bacterium]